VQISPLDGVDLHKESSSTTAPTTAAAITNTTYNNFDDEYEHE
jgi:hypothetical protein